MGYIYKRTEKQLWTVMTFDGGECITESDHNSREAAAARVHYLNGGGESEFLDQDIDDISKPDINEQLSNAAKDATWLARYIRLHHFNTQRAFMEAFEIRGWSTFYKLRDGLSREKQNHPYTPVSDEMACRVTAQFIDYLSSLEKAVFQAWQGSSRFLTDDWEEQPFESLELRFVEGVSNA
jgi:hypothetical protein